MARQFYALNGEVPIRITPFHYMRPPTPRPYAASDLELLFQFRTGALVAVVVASFNIPRVFQDFGGQVRKQAGVIGPTFTARAGSQIQQSTSALSHFRDIADLRHFGDGYIF